MISISFNHFVVIVCIIVALACVGGLIYDHLKVKRRSKPVKLSFRNAKIPRSKKRKKK
ncbi:hypothetical protein [Candidatus Liberibacter solanacearum]|uniref:hypothetical protein n=1 Tax=Candidatus Liberibacter solanacearum TaxID=556287 RepID=UPI000AF63E4B|nr:hypothetical protein [Candidatus Liberibacter solanacearum]